MAQPFLGSLPQTPLKSSISQNAKHLKQSQAHMSLSLPTPEITPPRAKGVKRYSIPVAPRSLSVQSQLPTPPGTAEKDRISFTAISSRSQRAHSPPPSSQIQEEEECYTLPPLPTPQSIRRAESDAYSPPGSPVTPTKPKKYSQTKSGNRRNVERLKFGPLFREAGSLSRELPSFSKTAVPGTETTPTRSLTGTGVREEYEGGASLSPPLTAPTKARKGNRLASTSAAAPSHLDDPARPFKVVNGQSTSNLCPAPTNINEDMHIVSARAPVQLYLDVAQLSNGINGDSTPSRAAPTDASEENGLVSARAPAQSQPDDLVVRLSEIFNEQATKSRRVGLCPRYANLNWTGTTTDGPPAFFYTLPSVVPHLALWPEGGIGIFSNKQCLKYFQAYDVAVLVNRERGEKVCDTETVNDVGHILHYEMGLGKTVTTIALIVLNPAPSEFKGCRATLVVTPNKGIMSHWRDEIAKFAPHLRVCYCDSGSVEIEKLGSVDVVVCTYHQVRLQHGTVLKYPDGKLAPLFQKKWFRVVLDEAHVARNTKSKTAQAIWALRKWHGLCLTGTPAQNSIHDLYSLFRFLGVTYEGINDLKTFELKVCPERPKSIPKSRILDVLKRDFCVARDRSLIHLPKRTDTTIEVIFTPQERLSYSSIKEWNGWRAKVVRLQQFCDHPSLIGEELSSEFCHEDESPDPEGDVNYKDKELKAPCIDTSKFDTSSKIEVMMRILKSQKERNPRQKMIVFTHFVAMIPFIKKALSDSGIGCTTYTGAMSSLARENALKKIARDDDSCTVIIVSIMAGGVGLNITACNTVILLEPWWNPSVEEQAISRAYRTGQKLPVNVFRLVVKESIEEYIEKTQIFKREMMKGMSGQYSPIKRSTLGEWLAGH